MFENVGEKIKTVAKVVCWIGIIISAVYGLISFAENGHIMSLIIWALGALLSWIGSFVMYGFGQLVVNSDIIVDNVKSHGEK